MIGSKLIAATVAGAAVGAGTLALAPSQAAPEPPPTPAATHRPVTKRDPRSG